MRTPRYLLLAVVLTSFALLGAQCGNEEEEERPLPDRANAASPLLRTYYQTQTFPKDMRAIKIPEGDAFDEDQLTVKFGMSGTDPVTDVVVGVTVSGNNDPENYDLHMRLISPAGTKSAWKAVELAAGDVYFTKPDVPFNHEFDTEPAQGTWKVELRDPIRDNDGRMHFRNATVRINDGEVATIRTLGDNATETVTLNSSQGRYDVVPEVFTGSFKGDFGHFGVDAMLHNQFTFTQSFSVRTLQITFAVLELPDAKSEDLNLTVLIISPSGNYVFGATDKGSPQLEVATDTFSNAYSFTLSDFRGEPSLGTWTFALVDTKRDTRTFELQDVGPVTVAMMTTIQSLPMSITLNGRTYI